MTVRVGNRRDRRRLAAAALTAALLLATSAAAVPASAQAEPFDLRIRPDSGSQYLDPGASATLFWLCVTEPASIDIIIRDAAGELVRTLWQDIPWTGHLCADGYSAPGWDLTNDAGQSVPSGVYTVEISARTEAGATDVETFQRGVFTRSSWASPLRLSTGRPCAARSTCTCSCSTSFSTPSR